MSLTEIQAATANYKERTSDLLERVANLKKTAGMKSVSDFLNVVKQTEITETYRSVVREAEEMAADWATTRSSLEKVIVRMPAISQDLHSKLVRDWEGIHNDIERARELLREADNAVHASLVGLLRTIIEGGVLIVKEWAIDVGGFIREKLKPKIDALYRDIKALGKRKD